MPIILTGSKYAGVVTTVGSTTRLIHSTGSFSLGDFEAQRIIGLWNAAGTTYKGVAWVRRHISATELETESPFIDKSGNQVTQVVGDTYQVSRTFADVAQTGIAISGKSVTITDRIEFGTGGSGNSLCFYSEDASISISTGGSTGFQFRGGLVVFGHLANFATRTFFKGCNLLIKNSGDGGDNFKITETSVKVWWMGGSIIAETFPQRIIGHADSNPPASPAEWQKYWGVNVNCDICSPFSGSNWNSNAADQEVADIFSSVSGQYAINLRWANGVVKGGTFRLSGSIALSIFGSDASGAFNIGAGPGQFINILDNGFGTVPALWRSSNPNTQTINYTNVIGVNRRSTNGISGGSNNNATGIFRFSGQYTNLINGTLAFVKNNSLLSTVQDFLLAASNKVILTIEEARVVGSTETLTESSWEYGLLLYGYNQISGTFNTTSVDLGSPGVAKTVVFGGFINQITDVGISQSLASTVAAYTVLNTFDQLYDYAQYHKALNTTNAIYPNVSTQLISSASGNLSTAIAHNLTIDSAAVSVFSVNSATQTITIKPTAFVSSGIKADTFNLSPGRTLTFVQGGNKSSSIYSIPATGIILVPPEPVNLTKSIFGIGATINRIGATGIATVTVDSSQLANITAGSGVTIQSPPVTFTAASITNGFDNVRCRTSLYLRRTFNPATDVNLTTNRITIAGSSGKVTQNTVIRFAGTDISHPLAPDNVYYPFSIVGDSFSVSGLSGGLGTEVDLTNIGSGSMLLIAITELDMQLINSGAYTFSLSGAAITAGVSLTNGDTLLLQAASWKGSLQAFSPAIASKYLEEFQQFLGASISTLSKIQPYPEHNTFAIQQATDGYQISLLTVAGSTPTRYQWRVDSGSPGKVQIESEDPDRVISTELAVLFFQFLQWSVSGMRFLRGQIQAENLNSIQIRSLESGVSTDLTIESLPAGVPLLVSGAGMYRTDGKSWIAPGSPIQHQPTALVAVPIEIKVPINLSEPIVQLLHSIAAGVGFLTTSSGGGSGLTQQQIRDAQALALSAGATIAVTSIDSKLDNAGSDFVIL